MNEKIISCFPGMSELNKYANIFQTAVPKLGLKKRRKLLMKAGVKTERITILCTPKFKAYLIREAKREGISVSQFVRQRCENKPQTQDEEMLATLLEQVKAATTKASTSLEKGLSDARQVLAELRRKA